ncbi:MAG: hypothetical protein GY792_07775 [Gammaproteobacteria bacterium]|nr:hypothetical protein [Gammaproteobacteria bacterium]
MTRPAYNNWMRLVVAVVLIGNVAVVLLAVAWWITNLGTRPAYGDSSQYLRLADTLRVDDFRTLFYPLVLRGLKSSAILCGCRIELLVGLVQTLLALTSFAYLGRALWDVTAATERFSDLERVSALRRWAVIGVFAMLVFSQPLVNHFALSIMTDSLATSFTAAGLASIIRIATLGDTRTRTVAIGCLAIAAAGFMRAEKVYVLALILVFALVAVCWMVRSTPTRGSSYMLSRHRTLAFLTLLLLIPGIAVTFINRATQTPGIYGWPPVTINVRLFVRTVWPNLAELRPSLSQEFRAVVSEKDAEAFDRDFNQYLRLVPLLQRHAGGTDRLVNEASGMAIQKYGPEIAIRTATDTLRYAIPLVSYPADLAGVGGRGSSHWTHTRMRAARPLLTEVYLWLATAVLLTIQIPVALSLFIGIRGAWSHRVIVAVGLMAGVAIINAVLYSLGNGVNNVRYGLPACVLLFAPIIWGNLVWFASRIGPKNGGSTDIAPA